MKASPLPPVRAKAAAHFRGQIERAEADGISREDMKLLLTFSDVSQLKRDNSLALTDISFSSGVMRYLGVEVQQGGVTTSALDLP